MYVAAAGIRFVGLLAVTGAFMFDPGEDEEEEEEEEEDEEEEEGKRRNRVRRRSR